mmetsp:Transcript_87017/g.145186  ORF Transcript_87017/g.145186 Transcript_87017/m.145186 type:complete len:153 (-) Transcript_87017:354-812(-)
MRHGTSGIPQHGHKSLNIGERVRGCCEHIVRALYNIKTSESPEKTEVFKAVLPSVMKREIPTKMLRPPSSSSPTTEAMRSTMNGWSIDAARARPDTSSHGLLVRDPLLLGSLGQNIPDHFVLVNGGQGCIPGPFHFATKDSGCVSFVRSFGQ